MIPIQDSAPHRRPAVITASLIAGCIAIFFYELALSGLGRELFIDQWGVIPRRVLAALRGAPGVPTTALVTLVTSEFLHGGWLHLGGNMIFLWVFGRAVEDRFGHGFYLLLYLLAGAGAGLAQSLVSGPADSTAIIGASGAIAAVLGAYLVSFPRAWVTILVPVLFFFWAFDLPAVLVLAFWFVTQFFSGVAGITQATHAGSNVAVWAHIAGFLLGAAVAWVFPERQQQFAHAPPPALRRTAGPGPVRLVGSVANLLVVLLLIRLVAVFLGLAQTGSPLIGLLVPILTVTHPFVSLFAGAVPAVRVGRAVLETYTLVAVLAVWLMASLLTAVIGGGNPRERSF